MGSGLYIVLNEQYKTDFEREKEVLRAKDWLLRVIFKCSPQEFPVIYFRDELGLYVAK